MLSTTFIFLLAWYKLWSTISRFQFLELCSSHAGVWLAVAVIRCRKSKMSERVHEQKDLMCRWDTWARYLVVAIVDINFFHFPWLKSRLILSEVEISFFMGILPMAGGDFGTIGLHFIRAWVKSRYSVLLHGDFNGSILIVIGHSYLKRFKRKDQGKNNLGPNLAMGHSLQIRS